MTMSIVARSVDGRSIGIVCATGGLAVGGFVPHIRIGAGAVVTPGFSTCIPSAEFALEELGRGRGVEQVVLALRERDVGADWRQIAIMDMRGECAGWTGAMNVGCCGLYMEEGLVIAGNMLHSDRVVPAMRERMADRSGVEGLPGVLLAALEAGQAEGGDSRGCHSAALLMCGFDHPPLSLRVDRAQRPIEALLGLYGDWLRDGDFQGFLRRIPTERDPYKY